MVPASSSPQLPGVVEPKRQTLLADDFVRDRDASLGEQIFHITENSGRKADTAKRCG